MTNQIAISVKLDNDIFNDINLLSKELDCNRNRLINFACRFTCDSMLGSVTKLRLTSEYGKVFKFGE